MQEKTSLIDRGKSGIMSKFAKQFQMVQVYVNSASIQSINGYFSKLDIDVLLKIIQFLNLVDLCGILYQTNRQFKKILEINNTILHQVDLINLPYISLPYVNKILNPNKQVRSLKMSGKYQLQDVQLFLSQTQKYLRHLHLDSINYDFRVVFVQKLTNITSLSLHNGGGRTKDFDEIEIKSIIWAFPNLTALKLDCRCIQLVTVKQFIKEFHELESLELTMCQELDNQLIVYLVRYLSKLKHLKLSALHNNYNHLISFDGFQHIKNALFQLESLHLDYFAGVGDKCISLVAYMNKETLHTLIINRNCFVKCASISEKCFDQLSQCSRLHTLSLVYSRKLQNGIGQNLLWHLHNLRKLDISDCCLQEEMSDLGGRCPFLQEVNLSGDSWVHESTLLGISRHPNIRVFSMGHFQHSDSNCQKNLHENPSKGMFIEAIFKQKDSKGAFTHFPALTTLHLEKNCALTYWLDIRLLNIRNNLTIKYTTHKDLFH